MRKLLYGLATSFLIYTSSCSYLPFRNISLIDNSDKVRYKINKDDISLEKRIKPKLEKWSQCFAKKGFYVDKKGHLKPALHLRTEEGKKFLIEFSEKDLTFKINF